MALNAADGDGPSRVVALAVAGGTPAASAAPPAAAAGADKPIVRIVSGPVAAYHHHLSPQCLETLRYSDFHAKMMKKLQQAGENADVKTSLNAQENVFRQLMQKIKSLEMNYAIIDMYSAQVRCGVWGVRCEVLGGVGWCWGVLGVRCGVCVVRCVVCVVRCRGALQTHLYPACPCPCPCPCRPPR